MSTFSKPENALKRADELINVGQNQAALQALHDLITSKRHRSWQKPLEKIMFKYVELCVEMRKGRFAKDGLIQYRIVCQQVNVQSLEEVIKHFMHLAYEKAEHARSQAEALEEALDVEDLEADKRPEDLMMSYVSGEKGKERTDREHVTPWFKFLWETYRTVLEILRNNSKLETLYAMTAHKAFQFCKQYKRTTEFRRLCEIIRNHLANLNKYRDQRDRPDLTAPESLQLYLDTRVEQLKIATELGLWQEAFRSVEDIHGLMSMVKKTTKPAVMGVYYGRLTEIFWVSQSHLYHAYAWLKLFNLQKSHYKNLSQKDLQLMASSVLLAALCVQPYDHKFGSSIVEQEHEKERNLRMANLINFNLDSKREYREVISRELLLSELTAKGVIACVPQEVKDLYNLLENEFHPLDLASKVQPLLSKISKVGGKVSAVSSEVHLSQYIPALEKLATLRILQQVSQVFQTMQIDMLSRMIPFANFAHVERISVDAVKYNFISMRVDHLTGVVLFNNVDVESDSLSKHISSLADGLNKVRDLIHPPIRTQSKLGERLYGLEETVEKEHRRLLARKSIIEKRKEEHERQMLEMEREEEMRKLKIQKITEEAEKRRLQAEYAQRERERIRREIDEKEVESVQHLLKEKIKKKKPLIEGEKITKEAIMELHMSEKVKERQEAEKKQQKLVKTMDYLERARREEEAPLIEQAFLQHLEEERILHEQEQRREIELGQQHHAGDLQEKHRLSRMLEYKNLFQQTVVARREAEINRLKKERDDRISQMIAERKLEREKIRKLIYFLDSEEKRVNREREEEEMRKREEEERKRKEEAEKQARLDAIEEKKRQREREIEEKKERERREALLGKSLVRPDAAPVPAEASSAAPAQVAVTANAAAPAPASEPTKYVPKFKRAGAEGQRGAGATAVPPPESSRWGRQEPPRQDARPRADDRPPASGERWRPSSRTPSSNSTWSSSKPRN